MKTDPVCGIVVAEDDRKYLFVSEYGIFYFCSEECQEEFSQGSRYDEYAQSKGVVSRFLAKIARANKKNFGGKPPRCH